MKKITLLFAFLLATIGWQSNAQAVNSPANWPDATWTINVIAHTGANPQDIEKDPTVDDMFGYDDDDTGGSSEDQIAAESPVIDITAAQTAGENNLHVTGSYVYNYVSGNEYLAIEYWDADASSWALLHQFPNADTPGAPYDNYFNGTFVDYDAVLDITAFTATQLSGFKYRFIYTDDGGWKFGFAFSSPNVFSTAYSNPAFSLTANPDCANNQFSIDVDITSLGGATSVTVSDDQGSATQQATATGIVTMGPYPSGTDVAITVTNDQDANYTTTENIRYGCPPANDVCNGAIALNVDPDACVTPTVADNTFATDSGVAAPTCAEYSGGDLWFSATIPASGSLTIESSTITGSDFTDSGMAVYSGDCANLTEMECNDDGGAGTMSKVELTGQTAGDVVYIRVWEYGNNAFGEINVCAFDPLATLENNHISGFNFYPNPVNNTLNMSAQDNIEKVSIYNISGQEVINVTPNAVQTQVDMSRLQNGIYFVKAQVNGQLTAFKVVKK
jgi:hypothetical protein